MDLALNDPDLSPRELAIRFTDTKKYFVSEASVYRLLKSYDLIASPAYVVVKAAAEFRDKTTRPPPLTSTWEGVKPSKNDERRSKPRPLRSAACYIARTRHRLKTQRARPSVRD